MKKHLMFSAVLALSIALAVSLFNSGYPYATPIFSNPPALEFQSDTADTLTKNTKKIVGYYAAWAAYSGYLPDQIDADKLTHINYAFANIDEDCRLTFGFPDIDQKNIRLLRSLKDKNPNLKILISVGGWSWSGKFSDTALTDQSRTVFADSCVSFLTQYGLDGIDLDWEYPVSGGMPDNTRRPQDKKNFTLLLKTIREKLDIQEQLDRKQYLLTIAGSASRSYLNNIEALKLQEYIDYVNLMTYDLHGPWDTYTDFHAPLFSNKDISHQYKASISSAVSAWLSASFPADKLVLGVPFYGYRYTSVSNRNDGLYQTFSGANSISYQSIQSTYLSNSEYEKHFHPESMVPWLFNGTTFITYENPQSIAAKSDYIIKKNLSGAMIWELSQDQNGTLLNTLYQELNSY